MSNNLKQLYGSKLAFEQDIGVYIIENETMVVFLELLKQGNFCGTSVVWQGFPLFDEKHRLSMMHTTRRKSSLLIPLVKDAKSYLRCCRS